MSISRILFAAAFLCAMKTHAASVTEYKSKVQQQTEAIAVMQEVTKGVKAVELYNVTAKAQGLPTILLPFESEVKKGPFTGWELDMASSLSNEVPCIIKKQDYIARNTFPNPTIGYSESMYNNEYNVLKLNCGDAQVHELIMIVDGKDWLDDANPGPNSGTARYEIRTRAAGPYDNW